MSNPPLSRRSPGALLLIVFAVILCGGDSSRADEMPRPPCAGEPFPPYPEVENSPAVRGWDRADPGNDWTPPACTGWTDAGFTTLVATAARFRHSSGAEGLVRRIGGISGYAGVQYWSTTHGRWQTLILDADALSGPQGDRSREDFSPGEMMEGKVLYYRQEDNLTGEAVYRMRIRTATDDRVVFDTENVSVVRYLWMTVFHPGDLQTITFLDRESKDVWRYYGLLRTRKGSSVLVAGNKASSINRAVAYYRFLAGIPTAQEPPAAP
ncbi:MAG TPA: DUF6675 family protein [Candidatus Aquicultoraceae bacterium]|nr:DUF6675 family protein [Candidatus Aquicultoraceae bacterium]